MRVGSIVCRGSSRIGGRISDSIMVQQIALLGAIATLVCALFSFCVSWKEHKIAASFSFFTLVVAGVFIFRSQATSNMSAPPRAGEGPGRLIIPTVSSTVGTNTSLGVASDGSSSPAARSSESHPSGLHNSFGPASTASSEELQTPPTTQPARFHSVVKVDATTGRLLRVLVAYPQGPSEAPRPISAYIDPEGKLHIATQ